MVTFRLGSLIKEAFGYTHRTVSGCSTFWSFYILLITSLFNHDSKMYSIQAIVKETPKIRDHHQTTV